MTTAADTPTIAAAAPPPMSGQASADSRVIRSLGYVTVALALAAAAGTFLVLMGQTPLVPTEEVVRYALAVNSVFVGLLVVAVGWEAVGLYQARRRGRAGARLHIRIVGLFSIVAAIPAVLVAIVASVTLHSGLDTWFSSRTHAIVDNSLLVADGYAKEHARALATDILAIKPDLERAKPLFDADLGAFQTFVDRAAAARSVLGLFLIHGDGEAIVGANLDGRQEFPGVPEETLKQAATNGGTPLLIAPGSTNLVGGVVRLDSYPDTFLYVIRQMDPTVVRYIQMITAGATEYRDLEGIRYGVQVAFAVLYLGVCLIVLLSAIWLGIGFANRLVAPIRRLIDAADQVARGNLAVEVPARSADGDVGSLSTTFNKMTSQLRGQRSQLLEASEQIDRRRRFGEAVLAGVTAGVIGIDPEGRVTIVNRMALRLLGKGVDAVLGHSVEEAVPELAPVVAAALADSRSDHRGQTVINRGGRERTINVRVTTEGATPGEYGYVITFDDITDLVTAQRSSAWADVARRIAHEIKNPLTPIQLSAERLKRKFGKGITEDREVFDQCTDTIIRQVGDIGRMVDEFSSFARMPKPTFQAVNLAEPIRNAVFLMQVGSPDIDFVVEMERPEDLQAKVDVGLISQALTNLMKNASEAIAAVPAAQATGKGTIRVLAAAKDAQIVIDIVDNGIGLPAENRHKLLEPYVTTREKGTGLGLAIVKKIIEDHGGKLDLLDAPAVASGGRGAMVRIVLPAAPAQAAAEPVAADAVA
ncbi:MAG: PAS domain-containing sensor histidine kinase [Bauldia sp.]